MPHGVGQAHKPKHCFLDLSPRVSWCERLGYRTTRGSRLTSWVYRGGCGFERSIRQPVSWPGSHCSSLVYDVRKRIIWTVLRSLRSIAGEVCQACRKRLAGQRPQDPHKLIRRGRRAIRTAFNRPWTSPARPSFITSRANRAPVGRVTMRAGRFAPCSSGK
jgi:hypothetical protein